MVLLMKARIQTFPPVVLPEGVIRGEVRQVDKHPSGGAGDEGQDTNFPPAVLLEADVRGEVYAQSVLLAGDVDSGECDAESQGWRQSPSSPDCQGGGGLQVLLAGEGDNEERYSKSSVYAQSVLLVGDVDSDGCDPEQSPKGGGSVCVLLGKEGGTVMDQMKSRVSRGEAVSECSLL